MCVTRGKLSGDLGWRFNDAAVATPAVTTQLLSCRDPSDSSEEFHPENQGDDIRDHLLGSTDKKINGENIAEAKEEQEEN